jgi:hypothetical protein
MRGIPAKLSVFSVVLLCVATLGAQTNGAMLYSHGNVKLNGQAPGQSTSIFSGDRLDTSDSSVATINRSGSSVVVNPNSSVQYEQSAIHVMNGTARVSTLNGMSAQAGQLTITPQDAKAKFDIVQSSQGTVVTPREGVLSVRDGNNTISLQPGQSKAFSSASVQRADLTAQASQGAFLPTEQVQTFETAVEPGLPVCPSLKYCLGHFNISQITPCRCR